MKACGIYNEIELGLKLFSEFLSEFYFPHSMKWSNGVKFKGLDEITHH